MPRSMQGHYLTNYTPSIVAIRVFAPEDISMGVTIYGYGGHLGHVI